MQKLKVGDRVQCRPEFEDYHWLSTEGVVPAGIYTLKVTHDNFYVLEGVKGAWSTVRFRAVTPINVHPEAPTPDSDSMVKSPSDYLRQAADTLDERGKQYDAGGSERSMEKTVAIFNMLTGNSLTTAEGWQFMKVLKDVRLWSNTDVAHVDSIIDNLGYTALLAEETISLGGKLKASTD